MDDMFKLFCECCEGNYPRWELDVVAPNKRSPFKEDEFYLACPSCKEKYGLKPLQHPDAEEIRKYNEIIRVKLSSSSVH